MKRLLFLLTAALLLGACSKEAEPEIKDNPGTPENPETPAGDPDEVVLYAEFSDATVSKTGFDGPEYQWRTGDRIRVALTDGNTLDLRYSGENTAGAADFHQTETPASGVLYGEGGFALYPSLAPNNCKWEGSTLTLSLKNNYVWTEGNAEAPMLSNVIEGENLQFYQLCGLLKLTISNIPAEAAKLMVLTPGYVMTKNMVVHNWSGSIGDEKPFVQAYAGNDDCVGLPFPAGTATSRTFYVPMPVGPGEDHTYPEVRIYLVNAAGNTISGTVCTAENLRIDRAYIKPMEQVVYPKELKAPFTVTTLFGNVGFSNPVSGKAGGNASAAILGAVRGMGWIVPDEKAFVLEQAQTVRIWDVKAGTLSDPYTYGDANHVPWLGNLHNGEIWFAEKAKAKVFTFNPDSHTFTEQAALSTWSGKSVMDIIFDAEGNAFVAVRDLNTIYKFDGGDFTASPSLTVSLGKWPLAMEFDADGNLIVATNGCQILNVNPNTGTYEVIAGIKDAKAISDGTEGEPLTAKFTAGIADIAISPNGDIYLADTYRVRRIRKGSLGYANAIVSTVAGSTQAANRAAIADGVGTAATFRQMGGLLMNSTGTMLYITDQGTGHIRELYIGDPDGPVTTKTILTAATFNIRFITDKDTDERSWEFRRTGVVQLIKDYSFDIVGFQESRPEQRAYMIGNLPEYTFFETAEEPCLAWKTDKFVELDKGYFYLSATPDTPSNPYPGWVSTDPGRRRVCQWIKLENRETGEKVLFLNTHLEVTSSGTSISEEEALEIRTRSAELICSRIAALNTGGYPVILGGDMNGPTTEATHTDYFKVQLTDSYYRSADLGVKEGPVATYNAYSYEDEQRSKWYHRIDYLYFKGGLDVVKYKVIDDKYNEYFPSDHWPLMVRFALD